MSASKSAALNGDAQSTDPLVKLRDICPGDCRPFHPWFRDVLPEGYNRFALARAILRGTLRHSDRVRVRCRALRVGQSWATRPSWIAQHFEELSRVVATGAATTAPEVERNRADLDAELILRADGI